MRLVSRLNHLASSLTTLTLKHVIRTSLCKDAGEQIHTEGLALEEGFPATSEAAAMGRAAPREASREADRKPMQMDDLFSGVWMVDNDAAATDDSTSSLAEVGMPHRR